VSLRDVYIPLRAIAFESESPNQSGLPTWNHKICDLESEIKVWIESKNASNVKFLCGGPGFGKSSVLRMLAEKFSRSLIKTIYVPIHRLRFQDNDTRSLLALIESYEKTWDFEFSSLLDHSFSEPILLLLDGLDELAMAGEKARQMAITFVEQVRSELLGLNSIASHVHCIISGRDIIVQQIDEAARDSWHLLPYVVPNGPLDSLVDSFSTHQKNFIFHDPDDLRLQDQRQQWWQMYGLASGRGHQSLPKKLNDSSIDALTSLPITNYLVAYTYDHAGLNVQGSLNAAIVFHTMLEHIYEKGWGYSDAKNVHRGRINFIDFKHLLEEIAIAAWHEGGNRSVSIDKVVSRCENAGLTRQLQSIHPRSRHDHSIPQHGEEHILRLCAAFYVREIQPNEGKVEFTHKSFADYLVACGLVRIWRKVVELNQDNKEAVRLFMELCGPVALDRYILDFLYAEVKRQINSEDKEIAKRWQSVAVEMVALFADKGIPLEELSDWTDGTISFQERIERARNIGETLMAILACCANVTNERSYVPWKGCDDARKWIILIQGAEYESTRILLSVLHHLAFTGRTGPNELRSNSQNLSGVWLQRANLQYTEFGDPLCVISGNLGNANLQGANMSNSLVGKVSFRGANLRNAVLEGAICDWSNFDGADCSDANFRNAQCIGTEFRNTNLSNADFTGMRASATYFQYSDLREANFTNVNGLLGERFHGSIINKATVIAKNVLDNVCEVREIEIYRDTVPCNGDAVILVKSVLQHIASKTVS
jgi:hypothetical protein